jgi:hypothetical protein
VVLDSAAPSTTFNTEARFTLAIDATGSFKPGHPVHLTLRGVTNFATGDAEIRLVLPEVSAARASSWTDVVLPIGRESAPELTLRRGFEAGEQFVARTTVTIPVPGYYQVIASAVQHSDDRATDIPHIVGDVSGRTAWLWIDENGGRITDEFDPTLFADSIRHERGPRSRRNHPPKTRGDIYRPTCTLIPEDGGTGVIVLSTCPGSGGYPPVGDPNATAQVAVVYNQLGGSSQNPLPDARIDWVVRSTTTSATLNTGTGYTDATGKTGLIDCKGPTSTTRLDVTVRTENSRVQMNSESGGTIAAVRSEPCGGTLLVDANRYMSQIFINLVAAYEGHRRVFFLSPDPIRARINSFQTGYYQAAKEVRFRPVDDEVFGAHGNFVPAHEHGHLWQDQKLYRSSASNGLTRYYTNACPRIHPPDNKTTLACAWAEGFADWYAVIVRQGSVGRWETDLQQNFWYLNCRQGVYISGTTVQCTDDGSIVQGAVHAFLWDVTDPLAGDNETHDQFAGITPTWLTETIRDCEYQRQNSSDWRAYTGIDHLISCLEQRWPYEVRIGGQGRTFFSTRSATDRAFKSTYWATQAFFSDTFRRMWLVNLYSKRPEVGTFPTFSTIPAPEEPESTEPPPPDCGSALVC